MNLPSHIPGVLNLLVKNNHEYCTYVIYLFIKLLLRKLLVDEEHVVVQQVSFNFLIDEI